MQPLPSIGAREAPAVPLADLTFAVAGAGRVGASLARWAAAAGARLVAVGSRGGATARVLAAEAGCALVPLAELASAGSDLLLVAVADPALDEVAAALARRPQAAVVLHTSGSRGASALAPLAAGGPAGSGSAVGSLHPLKAFPRVLPDPAAARGVTFGIDGDPAARELAGRLAAAWGAHAVVVPEEERVLYHLGATLAAGGVATLLAAAASLAQAAGLGREVAGGYLELARGALAEAAARHAGGAPLAEAITGPAARGDGATLERQLGELVRFDADRPELAPLVEAVAREALARLAESGPLAPEQEALRRRLGPAR